MSEEHDVAAADDLRGDALKVVEVDGTKILLSHDNDGVYAVSATCPHAGGPLHTGARNGNRVVCPWHKATFCLRTGKLLEPPAVDDLPHYPARIDGGRILVSTKAIEPAKHTPSVDERTFVIIGGGAAGAVAAQTLREEGFGGKILMLDREGRVPYDRTLLSKYFLSGEEGGEKTPLQSQDWYRDHEIERRRVAVVRLDPAKRQIFCADGAVLTYDKALIATGATPAPLALTGSDLRNVFRLRNRADAEIILAEAESSAHIVVLGAGFIGMEVAAALRERGLAVTVIAKEKTPFEKQLGDTIGTAFVRLHTNKGVVLRLGETVAAIEGDGIVRHVRLQSGELIAADFVVAGYGVRPATNFIDSADLTDDGGLPVDDHLCLAEDLYAAGDVAAFAYRGARIRVEHWRVAQQHGRIVALNMLGEPTPYHAPPVFWTIQYMKRLDYIGHAEDWDEIVVHGDLEKLEFLAYYVKNGIVAAAVGMDRDSDTAALVELFAMRTWSANELGDKPADALKRLRRA